MAVHLWLSHRLSMLVIIVYHTSCRYARENLKIFRFSKGKRGLGAKTPFSVFWCRPFQSTCLCGHDEATLGNYVSVY